MLLRRTKEHLKKQDWTAIGIDLVILILGVFIGIEAANWNGARHDSTRGVAYLERVRDDLGTDIATFEQRLRFWNEVSRSGQTAIRYGATGERDGHANWEILRAYFHASQIWFFTPADSTYDEMKSAGELDLVRNVGVRTALARYYQAAERNRTIFEMLPPYRDRVRGRMPMQTLTYMWDRCHRSGVSNQDLLNCEAPISEQESAAILRTLAADEDLLPALRSWNAHLRVMVDIGRTRLEAARGLDQQVKASLR
jgi:hypothetical protein